LAEEAALLGSLPTLTANFSFHTEEYAAGIETIYYSLEHEINNLCTTLNTKAEYAAAPELVLIGHSNGAVVSRGVIETCDLGPGRKVVGFVSVGGPLMGIRALPEQGIPETLRKLFHDVLNPLCERLYQSPAIQKMLGPAGYFYRPSDIFDDDGRRWFTDRTALAVLNNEVEPAQRRPEYKARMLALEGLLLIRFTFDEVIKPVASEFLGRETESGEQVPLNATGPLWDEDLIGLRTLIESQRVSFYESAHAHDRLSDDDRRVAIAPFLLRLVELRPGRQADSEGRPAPVAAPALLFT